MKSFTTFLLVYDQMGRTTQISTADLRKTTYTYEADNDLDAVANMISPTDSVTFDYSYNLSGQMTGKTVANADYVWSPGIVAVNTQYVFNEMNQVTSENSTAITYDNNGNLTAKGNRALTWSIENYLLKVVDNSIEKASYQYDAVGRRVEKLVTTTTTTKYVMDGYGDFKIVIKTFFFLAAFATKSSVL